jgi:hypothetical protein
MVLTNLLMKGFMCDVYLMVQEAKLWLFDHSIAENEWDHS